MENSIFYGTCKNATAGWMELDDMGEVVPMYPTLVLDRESSVSIRGTLPDFVLLPDTEWFTSPHLDRPMFEYKEGRRYLVIFGKREQKLQFLQKLHIFGNWQFSDYKVHIYDLDESPRELEYRRKIESCCTDHIKISSLKKVQEKVHFWKSAMDRRTVSFSEFIKDLGKPLHIVFNEDDGSATLIFNYYFDIENMNELVIQWEGDPKVFLPQIVAIEKNDVIIDVKEYCDIAYDLYPEKQEDEQGEENIILGPVTDLSSEMEEEK